MSDLRDELAEALFGVIDHERADDWMQYEVREACALAADALMPIIERETERARAEVGSLIRAHRDAEAAYWAMADDADAETAKRLATEVTRTYEALLASVEGES